MAEFPALPLWTDAYMLDCGHLTDAEHGRYLRILILMWHSPQCRIPNDPEWIARKLNRSVEDYHSQIAPIISEFCYSTGNWLEQKRLIKEYKYLQKQSKKQSDNAKSRWDKDNDTSQTDAKAMPNECQTHAPTPTPTPTPNSSIVARDKFEEVDAALRNIDGIKEHPIFADPVIAPIWQLTQQGYDLKTQIIPSIKRMMQTINGKRITRWSYFVPGITEDAKAAAPPTVIASYEKWAQRLAWARKHNQWGTVWGPMPGQQGCAVPTNLLKPGDGKGWTEWKATA